MATFKNNLPEVKRKINEAAHLALVDTFEEILRLVRAYAPVRTGELRDSYKIQEVSYLHFMIGTALLRAIFSEFGTSRQAAAPHLTPAAHQGQGYFKKRIVERLKEIK